MVEDEKLQVKTVRNSGPYVSAFTEQWSKTKSHEDRARWGGEEMTGVLKIGTIGEQRFVVEAKHAIDFADERMPAVLSTPWLIWFLEHAARAAVLPVLSAGESTVGTLVEVHHLAATPVGQSVSCVARVIGIEGRAISFSLEARDQHELICRGFHKLRIISVERFAQRIKNLK